jgi:HTH-type transcriptional regulator / antitoxin HipB
MNSSVTLTSMAQEEKSATEEWISPIGHTIDDLIAELEEENPGYRRERELNRPRRELARIVMLRRAELGISQQELAERMGTSLSVISRLERSGQNFSLTTLQRLAAALDTKLAYSFEPNQADEPTRVVVP